MKQLAMAAALIAVVTLGAFYFASRGWFHSASLPTVAALLVTMIAAAFGSIRLAGPKHATTAGAVALSAVLVAAAISSLSAVFAVNRGGSPYQFPNAVFLAISMMVGTTTGLALGGLIGVAISMIAWAFRLAPLVASISACATIGAAIGAAFDSAFVLHDKLYWFWSRSTVYHHAAPTSMAIVAGWSLSLALAVAVLCVIAVFSSARDTGHKRAVVVLAVPFAAIFFSIVIATDMLATLKLSPMSVAFSRKDSLLTIVVHREEPTYPYTVVIGVPFLHRGWLQAIATNPGLNPKRPYDELQADLPWSRESWLGSVSEYDAFLHWVSMGSSDEARSSLTVEGQRLPPGRYRGLAILLNDARLRPLEFERPVEFEIARSDRTDEPPRYTELRAEFRRYGLPRSFAPEFARDREHETSGVPEGEIRVDAPTQREQRSPPVTKGEGKERAQPRDSVAPEVLDVPPADARIVRPYVLGEAPRDTRMEVLAGKMRACSTAYESYLDGLGRIYVGDRQGAMARVKDSIGLCPEIGLYHIVLGVLYEEMADWRSALAAFRQALDRMRTMHKTQWGESARDRLTQHIEKLESGDFLLELKAVRAAVVSRVLAYRELWRRAQ